MSNPDPIELDIVVKGDDAAEQLGEVANTVDELEHKSPIDVDVDTSKAKAGLDDLAEHKPTIDVDTSELDHIFDGPRAELDKLDEKTAKLHVDSSDLDKTSHAAQGARADLVGMAGDAIAGMDGIPPAAQAAAGSIGGIAQSAQDSGALMAAAFGAAQLAAFAFGQAADNAKARTEDLKGSVSELGKVSDEALGQMAVNAWAQMGARALLDGKNLQGQLDDLARSNIVGARRMLDHADAIGLNAKAQDMLRQSIEKVDAENAQAKKSQDEYGDSATAAAGKTRDMAAAADQATASTHQMIAALASVPPETRAEILADINRGDLAAAENALNAAARDRTATINVQFAGIGAAIGAALGAMGRAGIQPAGASASAVNVTQVFPRGWRATSTIAEARAAARRSGGLYQRARR